MSDKVKRALSLLQIGFSTPPADHLVYFIPVRQRLLLEQLLRGEEGESFADMIIDLSETIAGMPKTHEQDAAGGDAIVHLHYFTGSGDWWITEKDQGDGTDDVAQHQAFGFAAPFGKEEGEFVYISIEEMRAGRFVEIDLHWNPKTLRELGLWREE